VRVHTHIVELCSDLVLFGSLEVVKCRLADRVNVRRHLVHLLLAVGV